MKKFTTLARKGITIVAASLFLAGSQTHAQGAFSDLVDNGNGSFTNWIGTVTPEGVLSTTGWIQHAEHGRLWLQTDGEDVYLYDPNIAALGAGFGGWIYTNRTVHPYFYIYGTQGIWLLYLPGVSGPAATPRVFVDVTNRTTVLLPARTTNDILDTALAAGSFSTLATALTTADLVDDLQGEGPFTVFAPTDDAFAKLDAGLVSSLVTDPELLPTLTNILRYHVVSGRLTAADLGLTMGNIFRGAVATRYLTTLSGADLKINVTPFGVMINDVVTVSIPDIDTANGIIHVVDSVILPPSDIVDTAVDAGLTLATAVEAADLVGTLKGEGPFTVFAPVNEAFAALGDTLTTLLLPENKSTLTNILTYHVVPGKIYSAEVAPGTLTMANGATAEITAAEGNLFINGARIVATDTVAANGVIHFIESVILPPQE